MYVGYCSSLFSCTSHSETIFQIVYTNRNTSKRADGSKEKRIAKNAIRFSLRLKGEARVWLG